MESNKAKGAGWRARPEPVPESRIAETLTSDYIVVGCNISGICVTRTIAQDGRNSVIAIDAQPREEFMTFANDIGHINSKFIMDRGVEPVDPIDYYNDFMMRSQNAANPDLIMQFAQNMGPCIDWFLEWFDEKYKQYLTISYHPKNPEMLSEIAGQKFWNGALRFGDNSPHFLFEVLRDMHTRLLGFDNCDIHFETCGEQLIQDESGRVTGLIAKRGDGSYVRYLCNKAVVLAAGDFAGDPEMVEELVITPFDVYQEGRSGYRPSGGVMKGSCCDGSGIRMGYWAGGRLEPRPFGSMNGDFVTTSSYYPGVCICLDSHGNRFANEYFGDKIVSGKPAARIDQSAYYAIFDAKMPETIKYSVPGHSFFDPTVPGRIESVEEGIRCALEGGTPVQPSGRLKPGEGIPIFVAAYDLDTLAEKLGLDSDARENMKSAISRYNELCAKGRDEDFGKDPRVMFPIDKPPYICYVGGGGSNTVSGIMVTVGGLVTDKWQNVLDEQMAPVPGLYATGNCCGRRFGMAYFTPVPGTSIGICLTLGRLLGQHLADL